LSSNLPNVLRTWFTTLSDAEKQQVSAGWTDYVAGMMYDEDDIPNQLRSNKNRERIAAYVVRLLNAVTATSKSVRKIASYESSENFNRIVDVVKDVKKLDESRENEARSVAKEFLGARMRIDAVSELNSRLEYSRVADAVEPLRINVVAVSTRQMVNLLGLSDSDSASLLNSALSNIDNIAIKTNDDEYNVGVSTARSGVADSVQIGSIRDEQRCIFNIRGYSLPRGLIGLPPEAYSILIPENLGATDVYSHEYSEVSNEIPEIHQEYGITVNRGPLPSWAPDPYDYRMGSTFTTGFANSCYNIMRALDKRRQLEFFFNRRKNMEKDNAALYECALKRLSSEILEMQSFLNWVAENHREEIEWGGQREEGGEVETGSRYDANSITRFVDPESNAFYDDVVDRCRANGVNVPVFNRMVNADVLRRILSADEFVKFQAIYQQAENDWGKSSDYTMPSYVIMRGIDNVSTRPPRYNGVTNVNSQDGKDVVELSSKFVESISAYSRKVSQNPKVKSSLILITDNQIPNSEFNQMDVSYVFVDAYMASPEEIEQYVEMFANDEIRRFAAKEADDNRVLLSQKFSVPKTFVEKFADGLSGLQMTKVRNYLRNIVSRLFENFMKTNGDVLAVISGNELAIEKDVEDHQNDNEFIKTLGIETRIPSAGPTEYVTQDETEWNKFVKEKFGGITDQVEASKDKYSLLLKMKDAGIVPVVVSGVDNGVLSVSFFNEASEGVYFMKSDSVEVVPTGIDDGTVMEMTNVFGVSPVDLSEYAARNNLGGSSINQEDIPRSLAAMNAMIADQKASVFRAKQNMTNFLFLYGDPGSGKSIFAEVLSKAFNLRFNQSSLTSLFTSGRNTMFRGQSENNIMEFIAYCKNSCNVVFLMDEMHKFFESSGGLSAGADVSRTSEMLQTAWEDGKGSYNENNFFIVGTSNRPPEWFAEHGGSALMNRMDTKYRVEVPTHVKTLKEFFTGDSLMNNVINSTFKDDVVKDRVKRLIKAFDQGDENLQKILVESLVEYDPKIFEMGKIFPEKARRTMLEKHGVKTMPLSFEEKIQDFVDGWTMARELMVRMDKPEEVKFVDPKTNEEVSAQLSPLEKICLELERNMLWLDESETPRDKGTGVNFSKGSMRSVNALMNQALQSHMNFMEGSSRALPLNYQNLWFAVNLNIWNDVPDEAQGDRRVQEMQRKLGLTKQVDGWNELNRIANDPMTAQTGVTREMFLLEDDHYYVRSAIRSGLMADPNIATEMESGTVGASNLVDKVGNDLYLGDASFDMKMSEIVTLLRSSATEDAIELANFLDSYTSQRSVIANARQAYTSNSAAAALESFKTSVGQLAVMIKWSMAKNIGLKLRTLSTSILANASTARGGSNRWIRAVYTNASNLFQSAQLMSRYGDVVGTDEEFEQNLNEDMVRLNTAREQAMFSTSNELREFDSIYEGLTPDMLSWVSDKVAKSGIAPDFSTASEMTPEEINLMLSGGLPATQEVDEEKIPPAVEEEVVEEDEDFDLNDMDQPVTPDLPTSDDLGLDDESVDSVSTAPIEEDEEDEEERDRINRNSSFSNSISGSRIELVPETPSVIDTHQQNSTDYLYEYLRQVGVVEKAEEQDVNNDIVNVVEANNEGERRNSPIDINATTDLDAVMRLGGFLDAANTVRGIPKALQNGPFMDIFVGPMSSDES